MILVGQLFGCSTLCRVDVERKCYPAPVGETIHCVDQEIERCPWEGGYWRWTRDA